MCFHPKAHQRDPSSFSALKECVTSTTVWRYTKCNNRMLCQKKGIEFHSPLLFFMNGFFLSWHQREWNSQLYANYWHVTSSLNVLYLICRKQVQTLQDILLSEEESQVTKLSQGDEECFKSQQQHDVRFFQKKLESLVREILHSSLFSFSGWWCGVFVHWIAFLQNFSLTATAVFS